MAQLDQAKSHRGDAAIDARSELLPAEEPRRPTIYVEDDEADDTASDLRQMNLWQRIDGRTRTGTTPPMMDLRQMNLWQRIDGRTRTGTTPPMMDLRQMNLWQRIDGGAQASASASAPTATAAHGKSAASEAAEAHAGCSTGSDSGPAVQPAPVASAPPDLGNYNSMVGNHVIIVRGWDNPTIAARRVELQGRLSRTTDTTARDELLREYEAIEWVAHERKLALPNDPGEEAAPQAFMEGQPTKLWVPDHAPGMRAMLEREMAAGTGYAAAREDAALRIGYATMSGSATDHDKYRIGEQQLALMDHDVAAFRTAFQKEAKQTAIAMLDASSGAVDGALRSYGIAGGGFRLTDAAHKVARDPGALDGEVDKWVALSVHADGNHAAFTPGHIHREALAKEAERLRALQANIAALASEQLWLLQLVQARHPEHPGMPRPPKPPQASDKSLLDGLMPPAQPLGGSVQNPFDQISKPATSTPEQQLTFVRVALQTRQAQFKAAWIEAEREHPVLAAYRAGKPPDASTLTAMGSDEATMRSVIQHVLPKLGNIYRTKAALHSAWGTLDPLQLAPVVELTKQRMFVAEGSYRDRVVHDMVEQAHAEHGSLVQWALEAVMIGLTLVTLVPSAGTSAMAGLALTGLAYDLYAGLGEYEDFQLASAATDTDLDKIRSLSDSEPSLAPLLMRILSAGGNVTMAAGLFKRAVALRHMAIGGTLDPEALAALNRAGEAAGVTGVGDEAIASGGASAAPASATATSHSTAVETPSQGDVPHQTSVAPAERTDAQINHAASGDHGAHGAAGKVAEFDARPRITPERVHELSQRLGIPVAIDDTGALRDGIELHYVPGPGQTIQPTMVRVGRDAIVADILAHGDVIGRVTRYNGALGKLRKLWDRLVALLKRTPQPFQPGSPVWRSYQELAKLDDLIALRQSARMGHSVVSPEILDREIEFLEGYRAHHEAIVANAEQAGTLGKPAAGHIDSPDRWRAALGRDDPSVGGMHEIDPLGNEPHQTRLPAAKDIDPAVTPAKANSGFWEDENARGNTPWHSDNQRVNEITGYKPVIYKDGYPVLEPYTQETVYLKKMLGDERDFIPCDRELAKRHRIFKADGTPNRTWGKDYRDKNGLTWHHHQDGERMQLVPTDLHTNIPHVGGASAARGVRE